MTKGGDDGRGNDEFSENGEQREVLGSGDPGRNIYSLLDIQGGTLTFGDDE